MEQNKISLGKGKVLQSIEAGPLCCCKRVSSFLKCLWVFFWWTRMNPHLHRYTCYILVPSVGLKKDKGYSEGQEGVCHFETWKDKRPQGKGTPGWEGPWETSHPRNNSCAVIKMPVKRKWNEGEGKTDYRASGIKQHCHWFQATPRAQLKLKVWKQVMRASKRAHQKGEPILLNPHPRCNTRNTEEETEVQK